MTVRKNDILKRRSLKQEAIDTREAKVKQKKEREEKRERDLRENKEVSLIKIIKYLFDILLRFQRNNC